jgi:type II secretory pathway component GspD/PulD (secretin)
VVVTAQKDLMDQIEEMIKQLDVSSARDQKVFVYHLENGDAQQAATVLQGMFPAGSTSRTGNSSSQTSAMKTRETQGINSITTSSGSSSSGLGGGNNRTGGGGGGRGGGF